MTEDYKNGLLQGFSDACEIIASKIRESGNKQQDAESLLFYIRQKRDNYFGKPRVFTGSELNRT